MEIRKDRCLHTWGMQRLPDVLTPAQLRWKWGWWGALKEKSRHTDSKCMSDQLLVWYQLSGARCVHEHEGAWNANTGNGYYGGFQADLSFQAAYNPRALQLFGTANNWTPLEQIRMAWNGWKARGWYPWPNTARMCGLL